ncbi:aldehyde dehydrogenase family protein (plasmid) [Rhizobium leguminosarum]|nr:aldehyde dehydrogenase family protein [Rhizobium leguminosarum]
MNNQNQNFLDIERWQGRAFFADWQTTAAGVMDVTDPATGAVIASVGVGGAADIARAATEARAAQKSGPRHCRPSGRASCPKPPICSSRMARN